MAFVFVVCQQGERLGNCRNLINCMASETEAAWHRVLAHVNRVTMFCKFNTCCATELCLQTACRHASIVSCWAFPELF